MPLFWATHFHCLKCRSSNCNFCKKTFFRLEWPQRANLVHFNYLFIGSSVTGYKWRLSINRVIISDFKQMQAYVGAFSIIHTLISWYTLRDSAKNPLEWTICLWPQNANAFKKFFLLLPWEWEMNPFPALSLPFRPLISPQLPPDD